MCVYLQISYNKEVMMKKAIEEFNKQFDWKPVIEHIEKLKPYKHIVVCGMGGSHLAAGLLHIYKPGIEVYIHKDYDLPPYDEEFLKNSLLIASSYSGNTEETVSFLEEGYSRGLSLAVIATGGKLLEKAKEYEIPYTILPNTGIQPRSALGFSILALSAFVQDENLVKDLISLSDLTPGDLEGEGKGLAENLKGFVPVIYTSTKNKNIAYNWKIKFNETAKIPAFYNVFPELNHNEMTGFDHIESTKGFIKDFRFIFIKDENDHPRVLKRMEILEKQLEERGLEVISIELEGKNTLEKIFNSILLADWTALSLSEIYGTEAEQVPMIEEFKGQMK